MKKMLFVTAVVALVLMGLRIQAFTQTQVQIYPLNSQVGVSGNNTATITISGVSGRRTVIYQVLAVCNTSGLPGTVPTVIITDTTAGVVPFSHSHSYFSNIELPHVPDKFIPGLTFPPGNTVQIQGNYGGACAGGTSLFVQADQF